MFENLGDLLCTITGFDSFSLQPNAGAAGEYAGLMVIRAYHMVSLYIDKTKLFYCSYSYRKAFIFTNWIEVTRAFYQIPMLEYSRSQRTK